MKTALLLMSVLALAAPKKSPKALWTLAFPGERPSAAYFDPANGAIFVSLRDPNGEGGHIAKVTTGGKLEIRVFSKSKGPPGALRSFEGRLYWISGYEVESYGKTGHLTEGTVPTELGEPVDLVVARGGVVYVGMSGGTLVHLVKGGPASEDVKALPISGLFLSLDTLHILRQRRLQEFSLSPSEEPQEGGLTICTTPCHGLERTNAGDWLTVNGSSVLAVNGNAHARTLAAFPAGTQLGRPAYVSLANTKEDFFVLPFPALGEIRAYRVNEGAK